MPRGEPQAVSVHGALKGPSPLRLLPFPPRSGAPRGIPPPRIDTAALTVPALVILPQFSKRFLKTCGSNLPVRQGFLHLLQKRLRFDRSGQKRLFRRPVPADLRKVHPVQFLNRVRFHVVCSL